MFCGPFDEQLAREGPAAIFLVDRHGELRMNESWTRDVWGRNEGPHAHGWTWLLMRDHDTGYISLVLSTSPTLLTEHPRADVRVFADRAAAEVERARFGVPPIHREAW